MAHIVVGPDSTAPSIYHGMEAKDLKVDGVPYSERYPRGIDLKPSSEAHQKIIGNLTRLADDSYEVMSRRHDQWNDIDQVMTAYIPLSDYEKNLKNRKTGELVDARTRPTSIVVPYAYATLETILTYFTQVYLKNPVFQYEGAGPEDVFGAKLLEIVIDHQVRAKASALKLRAAMMNSLKYGLGPTTFKWDQEWAFKTRGVERYLMGEDGMPVDSMTVKQREDHLLYEGNILTNIDPYRYLPDPNVSVDDVQDGEYVGWVDVPTYLNLLAEERRNEALFNVQYLRTAEWGSKSSKYTPDMSARGHHYNDGSSADMPRTNSSRYVTLVNMYAKIIPEEWKLGSGAYPETWLFTMADDTVLIRAQPIDMDHQRFPIAVAAPDTDGFSATPISRMEMVHGLQKVMNWLFNSHITNVRKAINDMLIVDPSLITMKDLEDPEPGKLVRLRRSAWGRGVKEAVMQLGVNDITRQNIAEAPVLMDLIQRVTAATDAVQGIVRSGGERRSATEYDRTVSNALSRLEHMAHVVGLQYMAPVAFFLASHTQQYMSEPIKKKILGTWPEVLKQKYGPDGGSVEIQPMDVLVDYDLIYLDGSTPQSGAYNAQAWMQGMQLVMQDPELRQSWSLSKIFGHFMQTIGAKNIGEFARANQEVQMQTMPDEQVVDQAQQGNLVPLQGGLSA